MAQTSEALNGDMQCPNAERLAEQWFNEHESRRKEKEESLNFLLHMYRQDEEEFMELMDALEMIFECAFALETYTDMNEMDRNIVEVNLALYVDDVAEYYETYTVFKRLDGEKPEDLVTAVKEVLKFYNALQLLYEGGERIMYSDRIWDMFRIAEKEIGNEEITVRCESGIGG